MEFIERDIKTDQFQLISIDPNSIFYFISPSFDVTVIQAFFFFNIQGMYV